MTTTFPLSSECFILFLNKQTAESVEWLCLKPNCARNDLFSNNVAVVLR